ncbi:MAG: DUF2809 domain-containing protein [Bosea sp.]|uniref:ribosomal maturation YjgA family protein n=1 Tax=unclassified Bosea (in: a-proteobacteria) TaxID=2653178 RepID=UPI000ADCAAB1|nr:MULTISPECIES: DUF2809 domain-containing protein [unclassified Bosea (in: a-proteobacteria)]MBN9459498.1 DUF2809 domain-containing protein [Bosea sp. (in: a-proteobacteria)]
MTEATARSRLVTIALTAAVIASGLLLRRYGSGLGLPFVVVKYGGSLLWGMMVYLLLAAFAPRRTVTQILMAAALVAVSVELSRLYHTPWLDGFRLTTAGALLLGRVFSLWNLVAYGLGILLGAWADLVGRRR